MFRIFIKRTSYVPVYHLSFRFLKRYHHAYGKGSHYPAGRIKATGRTQTGINPVFISTGHKIPLATATSLLLQLCTQYRLPETNRLSDHYGRLALLDYKKNV